MGQVQGPYVNSYFAVPKSKISMSQGDPKSRNFLDFIGETNYMIGKFYLLGLSPYLRKKPPE